MTQKELSKLSRVQLVERLLEQTRRAEKLEGENSRLKERITERESQLAQVGALAETALRLSDSPRKAEAVQSLESVCDLIGSDLSGEESTEEAGEDDGDGPQRDVITAEQLEKEYHRLRYRKRFQWTLKSTVFTMMIVASAAVLVAVLLMPVLQVYGSSMNPTLEEGDLIVSLKTSKMKTGDIVAFYYNNKVLIKRVIGQAGQWIDIAEDGTVYVDNEPIDEPYLNEKAFGECDLELPYQVPESRVFVMGDNRAVSVDSRSTTVGCVAEEQLVGKVTFCVWPLGRFGSIG